MAQNPNKVIRNFRNPDQATFEIRLDNILPGRNFEIISFVTEHAENEPGFARVDFHFHGDLSKLNMLNRQIEISIGYHGDNKPVFSGKTKTFFMKENPPLPLVLAVECEGEIAKTSSAFPKTEPVIHLKRGSTILEYELATGAFNDIHGTIRTEGINSLNPGDLIKLESFGPDLNGNHNISRIIHEFHGNAWHTILGIGHEP